MIKKILEKAIADNASDIIFSVGESPTLKIFGEWKPLDLPKLEDKDLWSLFKLITAPHGEEFIAHLKKNMDADFGAQIEGIGRFRANAFFTVKGPSCVLRVVNNHVETFEELSLPRDQFEHFAALPHGLVLFTGSMGSGKSTSMASLISYINAHQSKHIVTIEDPIEYVYDNDMSVIEQREVGVHTISFQRALKSCLREAANVILLGELRDLETMELAITAAETGTLVFASLHTSGVGHAIDRIVDVFPPAKQEQVKVQLSQILQGVVWQMLMPGKEGGLVPATEILIHNSAIANLIRKGDTHQIHNVVATSAEQGMMTMAQSVEKLIYDEKVDKEVGEDILKQFKKA